MMNVRVRRQNHSCEQCRRSRKACDGHILNSVRLRSSATPLRGSDITNYPKLLSCSYCTKTHKCCSFNPYWGSVRVSNSTPAAQAKRRHVGAGPEAGHRNRPILQAQGFDASNPRDQSSISIDHALDSIQWPSEIPSDDLFWYTQAQCQYNPLGLPAPSPLDPYRLDLELETPHSNDNQQQANLCAQLYPFHDDDDFSSHSARHDSFSSLATYSSSHLSGFDVEPTVWGHPSEVQDPVFSQIASTKQPYPHNAVKEGCGAEQTVADEGSSNLSGFSFHASHVMTTAVNNTLITESLLSIYHDVLENHLACWLSEDTCPYKMQRSLTFRELPSETVSLTNRHHREWGSTWSNHVYRRVVRLDQVAKATGQLQLSTGESRAASKALSLAIMAFVTQWSQGKQQRRGYRRTSLDSFDLTEAFQNQDNEFEQNIKQSVWQQTERALQEVSGLESYQVVYAELIFGLIQNPVADDRDARDEFLEPTAVISDTRLKVMSMLASENSPIFMERATRKIHAMKFRFDAAETGFSMYRTGARGSPEMSSENRSTIGLLYWLAVMFDTVSSTLNERPVAVADEDCQHEDSLSKAASTGCRIRRRWDASCFVWDYVERSTASLSWPCCYDDATEAISRSAPVKVLLFRYISQLQNALRKHEFGLPVEEIIHDAILLYRYWSRTYGPFFHDLVRDYVTIPHRIKSWFICIAIPWHLGVLILADLIEFVDGKGLGLEETGRSRIAENMVSAIRKDSAIELSDLARVTTPLQQDLAAQQLPELHFAVSEGSLLTEPWTILLINAFTKAALFHLQEVAEAATDAIAIVCCSGEAILEAFQRADYCTQSLWFLGQKIEVARYIAVVLLRALNRYK